MAAAIHAIEEKAKSPFKRGAISNKGAMTKGVLSMVVKEIAMPTPTWKAHMSDTIQKPFQMRERTGITSEGHAEFRPVHPDPNDPILNDLESMRGEND